MPAYSMATFSCSSASSSSVDCEVRNVPVQAYPADFSTRRDAPLLWNSSTVRPACLEGNSLRSVDCPTGHVPSASEQRDEEGGDATGSVVARAARLAWTIDSVAESIEAATDRDRGPRGGPRDEIHFLQQATPRCLRIMPPNTDDGYEPEVRMFAVEERLRGAVVLCGGVHEVFEDGEHLAEWLGHRWVQGETSDGGNEGRGDMPDWGSGEMVYVDHIQFISESDMVNEE
ncbi:hypothetical protein B0H11DRAFT_1917450 [Mycena galericulata]|nr:hypothetical protein B0H11DRAFT_1917450 [Mycena galericulata]